MDNLECGVEYNQDVRCTADEGHDRLKHDGELFDHGNRMFQTWWNVEDMVNHPPHYTAHPSGIECIEIVRHMSFNIGNAVKYCWRAGKKGPDIEDLEKAVWYLNDEIARLKNAGS